MSRLSLLPAASVGPRVSHQRVVLRGGPPIPAGSSSAESGVGPAAIEDGRMRVGRESLRLCRHAPEGASASAGQHCMCAVAWSVQKVIIHSVLTSTWPCALRWARCRSREGGLGGTLSFSAQFSTVLLSPGRGNASGQLCSTPRSAFERLLHKQTSRGSIRTDANASGGVGGLAVRNQSVRWQEGCSKTNTASTRTHPRLISAFGWANGWPGTTRE